MAETPITVRLQPDWQLGPSTQALVRSMTAKIMSSRFSGKNTSHTCRLDSASCRPTDDPKTSSISSSETFAVSGTEYVDQK